MSKLKNIVISTSAAAVIAASVASLALANFPAQGTPASDRIDREDITPDKSASRNSPAHGRSKIVPPAMTLP